MFDSRDNIAECLSKHGYIEYAPDQKMIIGFTAKMRPIFPKEYEKLQALIENKDYKNAVNEYKKFAIDKVADNNVFVKELIYLKRLAKMQLVGSDLIGMMSRRDAESLVGQNIDEFIGNVDKEIESRFKAGEPTPLSILLEQAPTTEDLILERTEDWTKSVHFMDGQIKRETQVPDITNLSLAYDKCVSGYVFRIFPDQVRHCEVFNYVETKEYWGIWTPLSPDCYKTEITEKGLHMGLVDTCHFSARSFRQIKEEMFEIQKAEDISLSPVAGKSMVYTGKTHKVGSITYYEINVIRENVDKRKRIGNTFIELIEEIFRNAENSLRSQHGVPKIGEGWVSETMLFNLVKGIFSDAVHHARPDWLKPQHLDIYCQSLKLAFEYQGKQHYEPVEFFGGLTSHDNAKILDSRKRKKCKNNSVQLIEWRYDEPITLEVLKEKLKNSKIDCSTLNKLNAV